MSFAEKRKQDSKRLVFATQLEVGFHQSLSKEIKLRQPSSSKTTSEFALKLATRFGLAFP